MKKNIAQKGFTLVELITVIAVLAVLSAIVITYISKSKEKSYFTKTNVELTTIANAAKLHATNENFWPADISFGIPPEFDKYISKNDSSSVWPGGPWPGSYYDYESWDVDKDGTAETYQISLRFCTKAENLAAGGTDLCKERAPGETYAWAENFNSRDNSVYYCIKGYCRANCGVLNAPCTLPATVPGYCFNCPGNTAILHPGE